ncbi:MAG: YraN family protein [Pseudomonadota bacterium]
MSGIVSFLKGLGAEDGVERFYQARGAETVARRWQRPGGEVDLIMRDREGLIFVEVKSSRTIDRALARLGASQIARLLSCAEEFLATWPSGSLTNLRFDVAAVDGTGRIEVVENALSA